MTYVPAGKQGSGTDNISALYMGECEVTNAEFRLFMDTGPGFTHNGSSWYNAGNCESYPVETVRWYEAAQYCNWKTLTTPGMTLDDCCYTPTTYNDPPYTYVAGKSGYRLGNNAGTTSQSEWEYACRAGTTTDYYWGAVFGVVDSPYCWYTSNSGAHPNDEGQKIPNLWGSMT